MFKRNLYKTKAKFAYKECYKLHTLRCNHFHFLKLIPCKINILSKLFLYIKNIFLNVKLSFLKTQVLNKNFVTKKQKFENIIYFLLIKFYKMNLHKFISKSIMWHIFCQTGNKKDKWSIGNDQTQVSQLTRLVEVVSLSVPVMCTSRPIKMPFSVIVSIQLRTAYAFSHSTHEAN